MAKEQKSEELTTGKSDRHDDKVVNMHGPEMEVCNDSTGDELINRDSRHEEDWVEGASSSKTNALNSSIFDFVDRYEQALKGSGTARIENFLPGDSAIRLEVLGEILQVDVERRVRNGEVNLSCLEYFEKYPDLLEKPEIVISIIRREMLLKQRIDVDVDVGQYLSRLPGMAPRIHSLAVKHGFRPPEIKGYAKLVRIASGGMGVIFSARDAAFGRDVAIKVMKEGMSAAAFDREAHIMANLAHPCIPPIHAKGLLADGRPFFVMKLIHGKTLKERLDQRSQSEEGRTIAELSSGVGDLLGIFEDMCQAVGYAHSQGVIHRDIKPANIMVGAFGEVQVMDWGLAKTLDPAKDSPFFVPENSGTGKATLLNYPEAVMISQPGTVKGTAPYMAPEQARGETADARADVFSLGGILLEMLTGDPPFRGNGHHDTIDMAAKADLAKAFKLLDLCEANPDLVRLCKSSLAAERNDRPRDAKALALAMVQYRVKIEEQSREYIFNSASHSPQSNQVVKQTFIGYWVSNLSNKSAWYVGVVTFAIALVALLAFIAFWRSS